jgi:hypothetical protein
MTLDTSQTSSPPRAGFFSTIGEAGLHWRALQCGANAGVKP